MCQNHRKWSKLRIKSDTKFEKVTEYAPQIWPQIVESGKESASNLTRNFEKCQKMRLKSDPKNPTLPRAKGPNSSSLWVNENSVVLRNVTGVFYAKGVGRTMANPLQKVSNKRILPRSCVHSNKVGPTKGLTRYAQRCTSGGVGTVKTQSLDYNSYVFASESWFFGQGQLSDWQSALSENIRVC